MVKERKMKDVDELKKLMNSYSVVGLMDMKKTPNRQFNEIKKKLGDDVKIKMSKKSLMKFAMKESKEGLAKIEEFISKQPTMFFTNLEPFKFYKLVSSLKSPTYAKEGDEIGNDIEVKAGPTDLLPGPVISDLQKVGLIAGVEGGKLAIKKDKVIAKKGDKATKELVSVLRKLKITPVYVKLNIVALHYENKIYTMDVLDLVESYPNKIKEAFNNALNLSVGICYPTKENIKYLIAKAYQEAKFIESKVEVK